MQHIFFLPPLEPSRASRYKSTKCFTKLFRLIHIITCFCHLKANFLRPTFLILQEKPSKHKSSLSLITTLEEISVNILSVRPVCFLFNKKVCKVSSTQFCRNIFFSFKYNPCTSWVYWIIYFCLLWNITRQQDIHSNSDQIKMCLGTHKVHVGDSKGFERLYSSSWDCYFVYMVGCF